MHSLVLYSPCIISKIQIAHRGRKPRIPCTRLTCPNQHKRTKSLILIPHQVHVNLITILKSCYDVINQTISITCSYIISNYTYDCRRVLLICSNGGKLNCEPQKVKASIWKNPSKTHMLKHLKIQTQIKEIQVKEIPSSQGAPHRMQALRPSLISKSKQVLQTGKLHSWQATKTSPLASSPTCSPQVLHNGIPDCIILTILVFP